MKKLSVILLSLGVLILFQNCSNAGFVANDSSSSGLGGNGGGGGVGTEGLLTVTRAQADSSANQIIELVVDTSHLQGVASILWDHVFKDDLLFCQQTSNFEARSVTFLCPEKGILKVSVMVTLSSGEVFADSAEIDLDGEVTGPGEPPPTLTGAQLYTTYCIGCHGGIASTPKRGITLARLNSGLNNVAQMASLRNQFTNEQKQMIVDALK